MGFGGRRFLLSGGASTCRQGDVQQGVWSWLAVIGAPLCLGAATGFLTGQTGPDSTVVARCSSGLTAGGAAVLALKLKKRDAGLELDFVVASLSVVLFRSSCLPACMPLWPSMNSRPMKNRAPPMRSR